MLQQAAELRLPAHFHSYARTAAARRLSALRSGRITVHDGEGAVSFGPGGDLSAAVEVHNARFWQRCILGGSLGAAESFLDGDWTCSDLTALFRIFIRNQSVMDGLETGLARIAGTLRRNTPGGSRRNIAEHYDLGNDFFRLFLDDTLTYSCGIFEHPGASMREASLAKLDRLCRKLRLEPRDHLLEIGTGWGALAIHAATHYGCRVTTTTISRQQYEEAVERVARAGLTARVQVLFEDYRELSGQFDKLVSVEMIEAVGREFLEGYFRVCRDRLAPGGLVALQAILMADHRYQGYCQRVDFIQKYVFPGSHLPSLDAIQAAIGRAGDLAISGVEDITAHYAETLRRWRAAFLDRVEDVRQLGYPERLVRMWDYYFCYCEAGFEERNILNVQLLLSREK